jgi:hypothetical protein
MRLRGLKGSSHPPSWRVGRTSSAQASTADWLNTDPGELSRARVTPAHRDGVRRFFGRFAGEDLEVSLEATTGWQFVVEELQAIGADVHLAEPADTSSLRGNNKRAKTDRADARHRRELLMVRRLPEAWIPRAPARSARSSLLQRRVHTLGRSPLAQVAGAETPALPGVSERLRDAITAPPGRPRQAPRGHRRRRPHPRNSRSVRGDPAARGLTQLRVGAAADANASRTLNPCWPPRTRRGQVRRARRQRASCCRSTAWRSPSRVRSRSR